MSSTLIAAIVFITLALVLYTVAVWTEKIKGKLTPKLLVLFWLGLLCDTIGTTLMSSIATAEGSTGMSFHMVTGMLAILLMLFHALWATYVLVKDDKEKIKSFHKFSLTVWLIWLIPYISGMVVGMM